MGEPYDLPIDLSETSGVPTWFARTPEAPAATLSFRVGAWHEDVLQHGITHLVEHLAMHGQMDNDFQSNAMVEGDAMRFWAVGPPEDIQAFFDAVCAGLRKLPVERLEAETGVLRAETSGHEPGSFEHLLRMFFGPGGPGIVASPHHAYDLVGPQEAQAWADRHANRRNAALVTSGPEPLDLRLELPEGDWKPFALPDPRFGWRPTSFCGLEGNTTGCCLGALTTRTTEASLAWQVFEERLTRHLRVERGLIYNTASTYLPLTRDTAFVYAGVDAQRPELLEDTAQAFVEVLNRLRDEGPTEDELATTRRKWDKYATTNPSALASGEAGRLADCRLKREPEDTLAQLRSEVEAATPEGARDAFRTLLDRGLLVAPDIGKLRVPPRRVEPDEPTTGRTYRRRRTPPGSLGKLVVGPEAISGRLAGDWITIRWDDVVAVHRADAATLALESRTGSWMTIEAKDYWFRGRLRREVVANLDASLYVPQPRRP